ncbi:unnamed protein product [Effrenium voratum]|uniref:Uncharacterized protein n=1 Tax=Effrenium voratum TaxID=2562239 RepID=A0AA36HT13_9DINO|nr:unnamed protein product [Effrenium voratum]CAJ1431847.1 unnamed protein product [Effrenium voratum]
MPVMQQLHLPLLVLASMFLVCTGTTVHVSATGEASVPAGGQPHAAEGPVPMMRREDEPNQVLTETGNAPHYVNCLRNEGPHRMGEHAGGWRTPEECDSLAKELQAAVFGLEWPEGSHEKGKAQCAVWKHDSQLSKIDGLLEQWGSRPKSECKFHTYKHPLGGANRMALYIAR